MQLGILNCAMSIKVDSTCKNINSTYAVTMIKPGTTFPCMLEHQTFTTYNIALSLSNQYHYYVNTNISITLNL